LFIVDYVAEAHWDLVKKHCSLFLGMLDLRFCQSFASFLHSKFIIILLMGGTIFTAEGLIIQVSNAGRE